MVAHRARGAGKKDVTPSGGDGHLRRSTTWAGLHPGDAVVVSGTGLRGATWSFVAHVTNATTGAEWVEVVGGRPGDRKIRSFAPEQLYPATRRGPRSGGAPSLASAPQLPLP